MRGHGNDRDIEPLAACQPLQVANIVNGHTAARFVANLLVRNIEERRNLKAFLSKSRIVGEREPEISGSHDADAQTPVESENLTKVPAKLSDVVADPTNTELSEVREVLPDLRGVEMKLFGERLRWDRLNTGGVQLVETAQIDRKAVRGQLRHLVGSLSALVRPIHKG